MPASTKGWSCQLINAPKQDMMTDTPMPAGRMSATAQRMRPTPWVHA